MSGELRAIETEYDGHLFRSRVEARWAIVFNELGVPYLYESEGFDLPEVGRYLPDFYLPRHECWIEIKGSYPPADERRKMLKLCELSRRDVYVFYKPDFRVPEIARHSEVIEGVLCHGVPGPAHGDEDFPGAWGSHFDPDCHPREQDIGPDFGPCWGECATCLQTKQEPWFGIDRAQHWTEHYRRFHPGSPAVGTSSTWRYAITDSPRLCAAYRAARGARFEFGQTPQAGSR